jgi:hypothetical protein
MSKKKPTWVWIYGDEMPEVWEHFGFTNPDPYDRMKLKFVEYESETKQALLEEYDENG